MSLLWHLTLLDQDRFFSQIHLVVFHENDKLFNLS